ncbi:Oidioi.mRNA.OKI2018_I69.XSR.g15806.t1.cds [Oikopleura dioica]|uniref:Oidioi.mRNA.OKI2018_I69.XSR.g15806.t1.cds n=1 Tax=Oikopleura dioica TaxID=34765 RepID=A0ABN7SKD7_OIKDI|nr:Oidioi.mRNA.OKI2018_I69.XSR.g15806.t1.cds [Oikopleura dioica]
MVQASSDAEAHQLLKREILSLGGDLDDFELLKQVEDGEEEEWRPKKATQGQDTFDDSEFKKFFAKLDFAAAKKSIERSKESEDGEDQTFEEEDEEEEEQEPVSYLDVSEKLIASVSKAKIIPKKFSLIRFEEEQTWYEARDDFVSEQRIPEGSEEKSLDKNGKFIRVLRERAEKLLKNEGEVGAAKERKFFQMAAESGTQKDKVAAMVLKVQNAPVSNYAILEQLVKIVRKRVRREFVLASSHVKDLFLSSILPCTRPLREFYENTELLLFAAENVDTQDGSKALLFAIYEDYAKKQFGFFLDGLDEVLSDPIEEMKIVSLQIIKTLLEEQPEAEVNKIGDPKKKVVDRASKFITDLLFKHPNMQEVVGYEIENFLWRSNQSDASVLAGINLLNQFVFSSDRHEVPSRLIRVYFQFFQSEIAKNQKKNKKTELSQKILFSLLTGVNRAFPYVTTGDDADLDVHINNTFSLLSIREKNWVIASTTRCIVFSYAQN